MPKVNLIIDQGTTFQAVIALTDENNEPLITSGYTIRGQIRKHYLSANSLPFNIGLSNGSAILILTPAETSSLAAGRYVYDVELVDQSNQVVRLVEGIATVTPEVTK